MPWGPNSGSLAASGLSTHAGRFYEKNREVLSLLILSQLINVDFGCSTACSGRGILRRRVGAVCAGEAVWRGHERKGETETK